MLDEENVPLTEPAGPTLRSLVPSVNSVPVMEKVPVTGVATGIEEVRLSVAPLIVRVFAPVKPVPVCVQAAL